MKPTFAIFALCSLCATAAGAETFSSDVWADNWFEMRINGTQVARDSVPITTERSFNAERRIRLIQHNMPLSFSYVAASLRPVYCTSLAQGERHPQTHHVVHCLVGYCGAVSPKRPFVNNAEI